MNFASDNWAGATPEVMAALARHNEGVAPAYGDDALSAAVAQRFAEIFETRLDVHFVATGTAANALCMAAAARPGGLIFCSETAHVFHDEMGASEFFSGGMKLIPLRAEHGLITPAALSEGLTRFPAGNRTGEPAVLTLTEASELGTVYDPGRIAALAEIARSRGMAVHMDGARFANAVAATGALPAELTWKAGVEIMSFGGTKNGCLGAEAIVVFRPGRFEHLRALRQRAGQVMSKARFVAAQFEAYFENGGWLRTAAHANEMALALAEGIRRSGRARLAWEGDANEVFAVLGKATIARLRAEGAKLYEWPADGIGAEEDCVRLVTSWMTTAEEVERFVSLL